MNIIKNIANNQGVVAAESEDFWKFAIPLIMKIQSEGTTFFIRADGERNQNIFTIMIQGGLLGPLVGGDYIRKETSDLIDGVNQVIVEYAKEFWD